MMVVNRSVSVASWTIALFLLLVPDHFGSCFGDTATTTTANKNRVPLPFAAAFGSGSTSTRSFTAANDDTAATRRRRRPSFVTTKETTATTTTATTARYYNQRRTTPPAPAPSATTTSTTTTSSSSSTCLSPAAMKETTRWNRVIGSSRTRFSSSFGSSWSSLRSATALNMSGGGSNRHDVKEDNQEDKQEEEDRSRMIDGKSIANEIREEIRAQVQEMVERYGAPPGLAVILVGTRRDSQTYVNMKKRACERAGIVSVGYDFPETVSQRTLLDTVDALNRNDTIHGILVQLPLPSHVDEERVLGAVDPDKDVDGLHPANVAKLQLMPNRPDAALRASYSIPCTPLGCLVLLDRSGIELQGKHVAVIGRSQLVGLPMARLCLSRDATVTIVHSRTPNPERIVRTADVVIAAVGRAQLVRGSWLRPGAVVVDVGINSVDVVPAEPGGKSYRLVGDVDYEQALEAGVSKITPVPGGVGPMTIAMLLRNTLQSCQRFMQRRQEEKQ